MAAAPELTIEHPQQWAKTLTVLGQVVVVTAVLATIVSIVLVERFSTTYEDGLTVTEESAALVADAVEPLHTLADDLAGLALTLVDGLELAQSVIDSTTDILATTGDAFSTNLATSAEAAADVADRLADVLELIERLIPGESQSIAEELRSFADGLAPVADQLRVIGSELTTAATNLDESQATLSDLAEQVGTLAADISGLTPQFDALEATASDLQMRAAAASDRMGLDLWLIRILILSVGAVFVAFGIAMYRFARDWLIIDVDPPPMPMPIPSEHDS